MRTQQKAFTLIELLIVVAIIAILAAIAVPNFLEAQTRAKVSRVLNDMRTVTIAIQAYTVDNNTPPFPIAGNIWQQNVQTGQVLAWAGKQLTTPIAYLTTLPMDIQSPMNFGVSPPVDYKISFGYLVAKYYWPNDGGTIKKFLDLMPSAAVYSKYMQSLGGRPFSWVLESVGPDRLWWGGQIPPSLDPYDPTNGTVSNGQIWYFDSLGFVGGLRK